MKNITILSILLLSTFLTSCSNKTNPAPQTNNPAQDLGLEICPDEWIGDQEPGGILEKERQYYIVDGKRREIDEFNQSWIQTNCSLEKQIVE